MFEGIGLDGAKMSTFDNPGPLVPGPRAAFAFFLRHSHVQSCSLSYRRYGIKDHAESFLHLASGNDGP